MHRPLGPVVAGTQPTWLLPDLVAEPVVVTEGPGSNCHGIDGLGETELASIRFARDFTLHAHTITRERLRELRRAGLSDGAILDLAYVCAVFNGLARLVIALAPV